MNETNFRIECDKTHSVVTLNVNNSLCMIDLNNRNYITSMKIHQFCRRCDFISFYHIKNQYTT